MCVYACVCVCVSEREREIMYAFGVLKNGRETL